MVVGDALHRAAVERHRRTAGTDPPARHDDEVARREGRPPTPHAQGRALVAGNLLGVADVPEVVARAEVLRRREDLGRSGQVEQVNPGGDDEDDGALAGGRLDAHDHVTMPEPARS